MSLTLSNIAIRSSVNEVTAMNAHQEIRSMLTDHAIMRAQQRGFRVEELEMVAVRHLPARHVNWASSIMPSTCRPAFTSMAPGMYRTSMLITAGSKPGCKSFVAWPPATWPVTWAGSARLIVSRQAVRNLRSGSLWRSALLLSIMICEHSLDVNLF